MSSTAHSSPGKSPASSIKRTFRCIICTDSRGRGLGDVLNEAEIVQKLPEEARQRVGIELQTIIRPGAGIESLINYIAKHPEKNNFDLLIVSAGICNLTTKKTTDDGAAKINYEITNGVDKIKSIVESTIAEYGKKIHYATITPASLVKFYLYKNRGKQISQEEKNVLEEQQTRLVDDCKEINNFIIKRNTERECPTLRWASQCMRSTKRRQKNSRKLRPTVYKFCDSKLHDGLHPDDTLKKVWFSLAVRFISELIRREVSPTKSSQSSTTEDPESEQEQYNFKRQKRK